MTYMDNPAPRRPPSLRRRPAGQPPDPDLAVVIEVAERFPSYDVDQVVAEARRREREVTADFARAVIATCRITGD